MACAVPRGTHSRYIYIYIYIIIYIYDITNDNQSLQALLHKLLLLLLVCVTARCAAPCSAALSYIWLHAYDCLRSSVFFCIGYAYYFMFVYSLCYLVLCFAMSYRLTLTGLCGRRLIITLRHTTTTTTTTTNHNNNYYYY